ncbi:MAG: DJ-1/PfpI family protein [Candidatus Hydrothermarchaeaceae archaeon]
MLTEAKKAVLIIAHENFRDEEFLMPKEILERSGVEVTVASSSLGPARGMLGAVVEPDMLIGDINVSDYDAVVFIGGGGAREYFDSPSAHSVAKEAASSGKVLGAICIAPSILANAGILEGIKATSFPSEEGNLTANGANFTGASVEIDGKIITADGPSSAEKFGQALVDVLSKV